MLRKLILLKIVIERDIKERRHKILCSCFIFQSVNGKIYKMDYFINRDALVLPDDSRRGCRVDLNKILDKHTVRSPSLGLIAGVRTLF